MEVNAGREPSPPPPPTSAAAVAPKSEGKRCTPPAAAVDAVSFVLSSGDLLHQILLRLDFPTCLVRAAAVSRLWLRHASDPAFIRRFRDLHPPRLLGFYFTTVSFSRLEFVPLLPQPPELAAVLRRGCFSVDAFESTSFSSDNDNEGSSRRGINGWDCRNGRLFFGLYRSDQLRYGVHRPLHPAKGVIIVPTAPLHRMFIEDVIISDVFSREGESGGLSYFWFSMECGKEEQAIAYLYMLQGDAWRMLSSATTQISGWLQSARLMNNFLVLDCKIYLMVTTNYILVFDWTSSSFSTIEFPEGVDNGDIMLSRAGDSGLYLFHLKGLNLSIWHHRRINSSVGDWILFDTFCLHDMSANLEVSNCMVDDGHTSVASLRNVVGNNAEFVFLVMDKCIFYLDVRSRALRKVYEITETDENVGRICPFMMVWPPIFPALK